MGENPPGHADRRERVANGPTQEDVLRWEEDADGADGIDRREPADEPRGG